MLGNAKLIFRLGVTAFLAGLGTATVANANLNQPYATNSAKGEALQ